MEQTQQQSLSTNPGLSGRVLALGLIGVFALLGFWIMTRQSDNNISASPTGTSQESTLPITAESPVQTTTDSQPVAMAANVDITVEGGSFYFKPDVIRVKKGQSVKITLNSVGGMPHDFIIDELDVKSEQVTNSTTMVEFTPDQVGTFEYYCSVGKHRENGMKGQLIVE